MVDEKTVVEEEGHRPSGGNEAVLDIDDVGGEGWWRQGKKNDGSGEGRKEDGVTKGTSDGVLTGAGFDGGGAKLE